MSTDIEDLPGSISPIGYHDTFGVVERPLSAMSGLVEAGQPDGTIG